MEENRVTGKSCFQNRNVKYHKILYVFCKKLSKTSPLKSKMFARGVMFTTFSDKEVDIGSKYTITCTVDGGSAPNKVKLIIPDRSILIWIDTGFAFCFLSLIIIEVSTIIHTCISCIEHAHSSNCARVSSSNIILDTILL